MAQKQAKTWCGIPVAYGVLDSWNVFKKMSANPQALLSEIVQRCGPLAVLWLGPQPMVVVADPVVAKSIMVDHRNIGLARKFMDIFEMYFGAGVFSWEGDLWEDAREKIGPPMNPDAVDRNAALIHEVIAEMVKRLVDSTVDPDKGVDVFDLASDASLKAACRGALGIDLTDTQLRRLRQLLERVIGRMSKRMNNLFKTALGQIVPLLGQPSRGDRQAILELREFVVKIMDEYERRYSLCQIQAPGVLGALFREYWGSSRRPEEYEKVVANFLQLLAAAYETTSGTLTRLVECIAKYPEIFNDGKLQQEVSSCSDRPLTNKILSQKKRINAVVHELLRQYPPLVNMVRQTLEQVTLTLGEKEYTIPAGTWLSIPASILHRSNAWKDDPSVFNPWRFLGEPTNGPGLNRCPYGAGERICPGRFLATRVLSEFEVQLLEITRTMDIKIIGNYQEIVDITSRLDGLQVYFTPKK